MLGHIGISLLLFSPLAGVLLSTGHPLLAGVTGLLLVVLAPLPDLDSDTDRLDHRGSPTPSGSLSGRACWAASWPVSVLPSGTNI